MTDCKSVQEKIFDYIDGLLPVEFRKSFNKHTDQCRHCSSVFDNLKALRAQLQSLKSVKTSPDFDTVLRTRISMERSLRRRSVLNRPIRVPIYAAAGTLAFIAAFFIFNLSESPLRKNGPLNVTSSFSSSQISSNNSKQVRQNTSQIIFPMEFVAVEGGSSISSAASENRASTRTDSAREAVPESGIQPVGAVEF